MEKLDFVNTNDMVIGSAYKNIIYEQKLPHRIVHVLIYNTQKEIALQLRSDNKSFCPLHWSTAVGGHVKSGETCLEAALRETKEELGCSPKINYLQKYYYESAGGDKKFLSIFKAFYNGPFYINKKEVKNMKYFKLSKIKLMISQKQKMHPELLFILQRLYFNNQIL
ncbi:MAG: NUDIX domain-containing protein [Patescibacteria group bacterium]